MHYQFHAGSSLRRDPVCQKGNISKWVWYLKQRWNITYLVHFFQRTTTASNSALSCTGCNLSLTHINFMSRKNVRGATYDTWVLSNREKIIIIQEWTGCKRNGKEICFLKKRRQVGVQQNQQGNCGQSNVHTALSGEIKPAQLTSKAASSSSCCSCWRPTSMSCSVRWDSQGSIHPSGRSLLLCFLLTAMILDHLHWPLQ